MTVQRILIGMLVAAATYGPSSAQSARFVPLGFRPGGNFSAGLDLNADGSIVVGQASDPLDASERATRWHVVDQVEAIVNTGTVAGISVAWRTDASGDFVVGNVSELFYQAPFTWTASGGWSDFTVQGPLVRPVGVSADGSVIALLSDDDFGGVYGFVGAPGSGFVDIGGLPGGQPDSTVPLALSGDGLVVTGSANGGLANEAFRWTAAGGMVGIGFLPGLEDYSVGTGTSHDGSVIVGWCFESLGPSRAYRWTQAGGMQDLGVLPGGRNSRAYDVSGDGNVVVGESDGIPVVWTASGGMQRLDDVLIQGGAGCLSGWTLGVVNAISADGNAVTGVATNPAGQAEAYVAYFNAPDGVALGTRLCTPAVPHSSGSPARIDVSGSVCVDDDSVTLRASGLPPNQFGYFLAARSEALIMNPGGSQGNLCLGQPLGRFAALIQSSGPLGELEIAVDLAAIPLLGAVTTGETLNFQCWFRDVNPTSTSNFSDVVAVTFD